MQIITLDQACRRGIQIANLEMRVHMLELLRFLCRATYGTMKLSEEVEQAISTIVDIQNVVFGI